MKMKAIRHLLVCLIPVLFTATILPAQDFSKYHGVSLGMSLPGIMKYTGEKVADVKVVAAEPALIQEVTWWPPNSSGMASQSEGVREIIFSFYNGELYKMSVTYDRTSTQGLTTTDMTRAVSAKYGPVTSVPLAIDGVANDRYDMKAKRVASWGDSQYGVDLERSAFTDDFGLIIYSKRIAADADLAIVQAVKLEEQGRPLREAARRQKETDDLEVTRQKNRKIFQP
jgi:hypothetical protein